MITTTFVQTTIKNYTIQCVCCVSVFSVHLYLCTCAMQVWWGEQNSWTVCLQVLTVLCERPTKHLQTLANHSINEEAVWDTNRHFVGLLQTSDAGE